MSVIFMIDKFLDSSFKLSVIIFNVSGESILASVMESETFKNTLTDVEPDCGSDICDGTNESEISGNVVGVAVGRGDAVTLGEEIGGEGDPDGA